MKSREGFLKPAKYRHMPHVAWRRVEEESVLLNVDTSEYYSLDPVGTQIWEGLGRGEGPEQVAATLVDEYGIPRERAVKDTRAFVSDLLKERLIHQAE
ncbi:MAG: PqqD family protein [Elusimicrobia bacterium]|nr:PqqD family protein [Elusimicrobiota bacterium]